MVGLRVFERNLPDACREAHEQSRSLSSSSLIEGLSSSSSSNDEAFFSIWIPSTYRFFDVYKLSNPELKQVALILYRHIQESELSLDGLSSTLALLNRLLRFKRNLNLSINWEDLLNLYQSLQQETKFAIFSKVQIASVVSELAYVTRRLRKYFSQDSAGQIVERFSKMMSPGSENDLALVFMCNFIPNKGKNSCVWVKVLLDALKGYHRNLNLVINVVACLATTAKNYPGFDWTEYMSEIYNLVLPSMPLLTQTMPRPKTYYTENIKTAAFSQKFMARSSSFAKFVAYTLSSENFHLLEQWLRNMSSTIKEGKMICSGYVNYISRIAHHYCKRTQLSTKTKFPVPPPIITSKLVSLFLPYVNLVFFSGHLSQIDRLCTDLSYLDPTQVFPFLLQNCFSILEDCNLPHLDTISVLDHISKALLEPTVYKQGLDYLPLVLSMTLNEFTGADMLKCCKILQLYGQVASMIEIDVDLSVWAEEFFRSLMVVLSELEENSENKQENARGFRIEESLEVNFKILSSAVSDEIFNVWVDEFFDFISRNNCSNAVGEFGIVIENLTRRQSEKVMRRMLKMTVSSIDHTEKQFLWRLHLLAHSVSYAGNSLPGAFKEIEDLVSKVGEKHDDEAGALIGAYLRGLLSVYPEEYSHLLPSNRGKALDANATRGKLTNQKKELQLEISWRIPDDISITTANEVIEKHILSLPSSKSECKKYLKLALPLVKVWSTFIKVPQNVTGLINLPLGDFSSKLLDFEEKVSSVIFSLNQTSFIREDPILLESFVGLLAAVVHNQDFSLFEIKKSNKSINAMRKKYCNPFVPPKEKNLHETRAYLILKTENYFKALIGAELSQKVFSSNFEAFFKILLDLSTNPYKQVRTKVISSIDSSLKSSFINLKNIIKKIWAEKGAMLDVANNEVLKVQLELFVEKGTLWRKDLANSDFLIINLLKETHNLGDLELQTMLFNIFCNYIMSSQPVCQVKNGKIMQIPNPHAVDYIESLINSCSSHHWRSKIYYIIFMILNMPALYCQSSWEKISAFLTQVMLDESLDIRETGIFGAITALYNIIKTQASVKMVDFSPSMFDEETRFLGSDEILKTEAYKVYQGWENYSDKIKVKKSFNLTSDPLCEFFTSAEKIRKFIEFSAVAHMQDLEENFVRNPRTGNGENMNFAVKFLNNPSKFFTSLLIGRGKYSKKASNFVKTKAQLIKLFGKVYGEDNVKVLADVCKEFIVKEKSYQLSALEIFAGIGSACRYWENADLFIQLLEFTLANCTIHGVLSWEASFDFICSKQKPRDLMRILDVVLGSLAGATSKKVGKLLKLLGVVIEKLSWRGGRVYEKVFEAIRKLPFDIFAELRKSVAEVVSKVICSTFYISSSPSQSLSIYNSLELSANLYINYNSAAQNYILSICQNSDILSQQLILDILSQLHSSSSTDYILFPYLQSSLSTIFSLIRSPDIKQVTSATEVLKSMSALRCTPQVYTPILHYIQSLGTSDSKVQELIKGLLIVMPWYYSQFTITTPLDYFFLVISSGSVEVRQTGKYYLSLIWKVVGDERKAQEFEIAKKLSETDKTSAVFRISALVLGQKEFIESWKGQALVFLCRMKKHGGEIAQCTNTTIADFWKHHKAWWRNYLNYSKSFTQDEIDLIESFNSDHSYFA